MNSDSIEISKTKLIATTVSISLFGLIILFLIFYSILSPNNVITQDSRSIEIAEFNVSETTSPLNQENSEKGNPQPSIVSNQTTSTKNTESASLKTNAEILTEQFVLNKGKNITVTTGETENASASDYKGTTDSKTVEIGNTIITDNIGINLSGRKVISNPTILKDTKEQGKVVVEIVVDNNGNVINADPNGRGTTTSSPALKLKAKQAAISTKFSPSTIEEQKGTITIIFSF